MSDQYPLTSVINVIRSEITRREVSISIQTESGAQPPDYFTRELRALQAAQRILIGVEPFWFEPPSAPMTIRQMIAATEKRLGIAKPAEAASE